MFKRHVQYKNSFHSQSAAFDSGLIINPLELWRPRCATRTTKSRFSRHAYKHSDLLKYNSHILKGRGFRMTRPVSQCNRQRMSSTMSYPMSYHKPKAENFTSKRIFIMNPQISYALLLQRRVRTSKPQSRTKLPIQKTIRLNRTSQLQFRKDLL